MTAQIEKRLPPPLEIKLKRKISSPSQRQPFAFRAGRVTLVGTPTREGLLIQEPVELNGKSFDDLDLPGLDSQQYRWVTRRVGGVTLKPGEKLRIGSSSGIEVVDAEGNLDSDRARSLGGFPLSQAIESDPSLSPTHAELELSDSTHVRIQDLGTITGTHLVPVPEERLD
jgi:hypothetical protein